MIDGGFGGFGGPVWAVVGLAMLATLLVLFVRQLRQVSDGPGPLIAAGVVVLLVLAGIGALLLTGAA